MRRYRYYIIAVVLSMLPLLTSCRKDLCYDHFPSVSVELDWEQEWERDYGMHHFDSWDAGFHGFEYETLRPDMPEWVNLVKFNRDGSHENHFLNIKGGKFTIDNDQNQSYLLYNGDTEYIVLQDMALLNEARATTTSRSRVGDALSYLQSLAPETRTANPPDLLYAAYVEELPYVDNHTTHPLKVKMQPLVYTYVIRYEFEYGRQHVAIARGALGGMAESVYLRTGATSDQTVILLYDCVMTDYGCEAHVRSFGIPSFPDEYYGKTKRANSTVPIVVNLEVRLTGGKYVEYNFDVTDQIVNQPRGGVIRIGGIRVEDDQNIGDGGSPFDVNVSGWGDPVEVELPLNNNK